jgi:hypothetical protein
MRGGVASRRRREGPSNPSGSATAGSWPATSCTVVQLSFLSRPVCLPVLARLWRPRHTGKIAHARQLAELVAARYPDRRVHVVGDAAYVGERLRDVHDRISWTSRLKVGRTSSHCPHPSGRPVGSRATAVQS